MNGSPCGRVTNRGVGGTAFAAAGALGGGGGPGGCGGSAGPTVHRPGVSAVSVSFLDGFSSLLGAAAALEVAHSAEAVVV